MQLSLEPTDVVDTIEGCVQARIWQGVTDHGVEVKAWIVAIQPQTHDAEKLKAFERGLKEMPYRRQLHSFDVRMIMDD